MEEINSFNEKRKRTEISNNEAPEAGDWSGGFDVSLMSPQDLEEAERMAAIARRAEERQRLRELQNSSISSESNNKNNTNGEHRYAMNPPESRDMTTAAAAAASHTLSTHTQQQQQQLQPPKIDKQQLAFLSKAERQALALKRLEDQRGAEEASRAVAIKSAERFTSGKVVDDRRRQERATREAHEAERLQRRTESSKGN